MPANDIASRKDCLFLRTLQRAMQRAADRINEAESTAVDIGFQAPEIVLSVTIQDADSSAHIKAARILSLVNRASTRYAALER